MVSVSHELNISIIFFGGFAVLHHEPHEQAVVHGCTHQKVMRRCSTHKGAFVINDFLRNPHFRGGHNSWLTGYYVERASQFLCHFMYVVNFWKLHKLTVSASHNELMVSPSHDQLKTSHRGAFCQFPFRWIYYCHSSKSNGKETGKTHLCVQWANILF